jgi:hypothetical protein
MKVFFKKQEIIFRNFRCGSYNNYSCSVEL